MHGRRPPKCNALEEFVLYVYIVAILILRYLVKNIMRFDFVHIDRLELLTVLNVHSGRLCGKRAATESCDK